MKSSFTSIAAILLAVGIATSVMAVTVQSVAAPRSCAGCQQFKKLTEEFEKAVIEAATVGDPNIILGLLEQYNEDVRALDLSTPRE